MYTGTRKGCLVSVVFVAVTVKHNWHDAFLNTKMTAIQQLFNYNMSEKSVYSVCLP